MIQWKKSCLKQLFFFFSFFCMIEMQRQTLAHNLIYSVYNMLTYIMHSAMHNLKIPEIKQVLELQPFIPNANRLNT